MQNRAQSRLAHITVGNNFPIRKISFGRVFLFFFTLFIIVFFYILLAREGFQYGWHWNRVWRHFGYWSNQGFTAGPLLKGLLLTINIALCGLFCSIPLGLLLAVMRFSRKPLYQLLAYAHVGIFRNTPLLLQLFFIYFLVAPIFGLGPFSSAVVSLAAFEGAYLSEIFRAGILAVPRQQWEAAFSLGFNLRQTFFKVIFPQGLKNVIPSFANQAVNLVKDTSLVSAIAVADLTLQAQAIIAETFLVFEVWLLVAAIYLVLTLCISLPALWLEKGNR